MKSNLGSKSNKEFFLNSEGDAWFIRNPSDGRNNFIHRISVDLLGSTIGVSKSVQRVLEVGCSDGRFLELILSELGCKSGVGVDPSKKAIAFAKDKLISNAEFIEGSADSIPSGNSEFDLAVAGFFFYVVDRDLYFRVVAELDRVIKPGGFLLIIDFDSAAPRATRYREEKDIYSYRNRNAEIFLSNGHYTLVSKVTLSHKSTDFPLDPLERVSIQILHKELQPYEITPQD
jgi:ubiquinone/menaquinone biosynthesis C-methylase UbiE